MYTFFYMRIILLYNSSYSFFVITRTCNNSSSIEIILLFKPVFPACLAALSCSSFEHRSSVFLYKIMSVFFFFLNLFQQTVELLPVLLLFVCKSCLSYVEIHISLNLWHSLLSLVSNAAHGFCS